RPVEWAGRRSLRFKAAASSEVCRGAEGWSGRGSGMRHRTAPLARRRAPGVDLSSGRTGRWGRRGVWGEECDAAGEEFPEPAGPRGWAFAGEDQQWSGPAGVAGGRRRGCGGGGLIATDAKDNQTSQV